MKILIGRGSCEITFGDEDGKYAGKMLGIAGEGNCLVKEFYISHSREMNWSVPSGIHPNRYIGISVTEAEKDELLSYVIAEAKKLGYSLILW